MDLHEALGKLTLDLSFKDWQQKNKECYLAHGFQMLDEANKELWQIGFYNPATNKIKTFIVGKQIEETQEQESLNKEEIRKLEINKVKINQNDAMNEAEKCFKQYKEIHLKKFFIIQQLEDRPIYNITYFTQAFNTVNVKIDAETGKVIKHSSQKLAIFS